MVKVAHIYKNEIEPRIDFEVDQYDEATTTRTLKNIKKSLTYSLISSNYKLDSTDKIEEVTNKILKVHGLHKDNFDFINQAGILITEKLNSVSIDDNSNKNEKTIKGLLKEIECAVDKALGYDFLYRVMKELYGKKEAKRLAGLMFDYSLALADSSNILVPYCFAFDASKLVTIGRHFGQLESAPSKRISSYISALSETVHQLSSHLAGAVGIGTFFLDVAHLYLYKERKTLTELRSNKDTRKYIENEFQQFIHSVNHLSRNGIESPFSNISLFDRPKLHALIAAGNYDWYFDIPDLQQLLRDIEDHHFPEDPNHRLEKEYIVDVIMELQSIYLNLFDKGDPLKDGVPYRFPVTTINFSKTLNTNTKKFEVEDKWFLRRFSKRDVLRYNIFISIGTKVASCCRLISNSELLEYAAQSNSFGAGSSVSLGSHRVLTTNFARIALQCTDYLNFYTILKSRIEDSAKILKSHKQLILYLTEKGLQPFITNGWINPSRLFSTFGIIGVVEAVEILRARFGDILPNTDIIKEMLEFYDSQVRDISEEYNIVGNIEQIPGESMSHRLATVDKLLYGEELVPYPLYANQLIPLWEQDATVWERIEIDGKYNQLFTGGGIVHINVGERLTPQQSELVINKAVESGCEHFAITGTLCVCGELHTSIGDKTTCPVCGESIEQKYARTVGYWAPVKDYHPIKQEHDHAKRKEYNQKDIA